MSPGETRTVSWGLAARKLMAQVIDDDEAHDAAAQIVSADSWPTDPPGLQDARVFAALGRLFARGEGASVPGLVNETARDVEGPITGEVALEYIDASEADVGRSQVAHAVHYAGLLVNHARVARALRVMAHAVRNQDTLSLDGVRESLATLAALADAGTATTSTNGPVTLRSAAEVEKARSFGELGKWAAKLLADPAPPMPVLLARDVTRNGTDVVVLDSEAWLPAGLLGLLASPGGKGKTGVLMHMAAHVAAGAEWCGLKVVKPGAVALVLGEEDEGECHRRLKRIFDSMSEEDRRVAAARTLVLPLGATGNNRLVDEVRNGPPEQNARAKELLAYLTAKAPEGGWSLVVIDPLARFAGFTAEIDNAAATASVEVLESLTRLVGKPVVLVSAHTKKAGKDSDPTDPAEMIRGASALKDGPRWVATLEAGEEDEDGKTLATIRIVKSNRVSKRWGLQLEMLKGLPSKGEPKLAAELRTKKEDPGGEKPGKKKDNGNAAAGAKENDRRNVEGT